MKHSGDFADGAAPASRSCEEPGPRRESTAREQVDSDERPAACGHLPGAASVRRRPHWALPGSLTARLSARHSRAPVPLEARGLHRCREGLTNGSAGAPGGAAGAEPPRCSRPCAGDAPAASEPRAPSCVTQAVARSAAGAAEGTAPYRSKVTGSGAEKVNGAPAPRARAQPAQAQLSPGSWSAT